MTIPSPQAIEIVRAFLLRHGQTASEADVVVATVLKELSEGDSGLFEFFLEHARKELN